MDCPQCGAGVPSDDAFCGKCGYAMRDRAPERLDQSRIRVHEEPEPVPEQPQSHSPSHQRLRKHTVLGMPSLTPPGAQPSSPERGAAPPEPERAPPPPPPSRPRRASGRTPQKTMLGLPKLEVPVPDDTGSPTDRDEPVEHEPVEHEPIEHEPVEHEPVEHESAGNEPAGPDAPPPTSSGPPASHRARARVRYDSSNEPLSVTQRRLKALRMLGVMVLLAAAWLGYRFLTVNG